MQNDNINLLFLEFCKETEGAVNNEKRACDDDKNIDGLSESNQNTKRNSKRRINYVKCVGLALKSIEKRNNSLECDHNAENSKNNYRKNPTEYKYRNTYNKADSTAVIMLLNKLESSGNNKDYACNSHSPVECFALKKYKYKTDDDVKK